MFQTPISLICAMDKNRGIGQNNHLPWPNLPIDMSRFKNLSLNKPVIMGRKTFQSIIDVFGKPLPKRFNIIVSSKEKPFSSENLFWTRSISEALETSQKLATKMNLKEIIIAGGSQIYEQTIDLADNLYLTLIDDQFNCDTFFPDYSAFTKIIKKQEFIDKGYGLTFLDLKK